MPRTFPTIDDLRAMTSKERAEFRGALFHSFSFFVEYTFWLRYAADYVWSPLHVIIAHTLHRIDTGRYDRVIVNAPPRMGKSEMITVTWPAWHFCRDGRCNFIEVSYSKDLINDMSVSIRDILRLPEIAYLFQTEFKKDVDTKGLWRTAEGGGLRSAPSKGQITGFGAGRLNADTFAGAIIISDPVKPADSKSLPIMEYVNNLFNTTTRNRVNDENTPIIIEAQRLADNDLSGFLLAGGSGERWLHVRIPAKIDAEDIDDAAKRYTTDWDHGDPVKLDLPIGYVWSAKYGPARDAQMLVTPDIRNAQYMQNPRIAAGAFFRASWFRRYDAVDVDTGFSGTILRGGEKVNLVRLSIFADTAQKTSEANDFSVFQLWGLGADGDLYLIDQIRGKWEAPELETECVRFMRRYADQSPRRYGWREINIEDKSSGTGLIQQLKRIVNSRRVNPIGRSVDKVSRAYDAVLPIHGGHVWLPKKSPWVVGYIDEFIRFSKFMTHKHDDQMDPTFDAISELLGKGRGIFDVVD